MKGLREGLRSSCTPSSCSVAIRPAPKRKEASLAADAGPRNQALARVAQATLCDVCEMALLSHSLLGDVLLCNA